MTATSPPLPESEVPADVKSIHPDVSYSLSAIDDVHGRQDDDTQNGKAIWTEGGNWVIHRWRNGASLDDLVALDITAPMRFIRDICPSKSVEFLIIDYYR